MSEARFHVQFAGPLVTFQDNGRVGHMRYGVPRSGPMDRVAFAAANAALGNSADATVIEISLGGLVLECTSGEITVAIAGGDFTVDHAETLKTSWTVLTIVAGENLAIQPGKLGSWTYLAFAGEVRANTWLGKTATHSTSGFGGGALKAGGELVIEQALVHDETEGEIERPDFLVMKGDLRVVMGPQDRCFNDQAIEAFLRTRYCITDSYDRMGVRLKGAKLVQKDGVFLPSEPIVRGSVQVSNDGVPTVLLADHQTTGGYPKIATLISADIDRLVQMRSRDEIGFCVVSPAKAIEISRQFSKELKAYISKILAARRYLKHTL